MRLRLVDQFGGPSGIAAPFREVATLSSLVAPMGRPAWVVDLVLLDDQAMAELNKSYRAVPEVTDVLSFSYLLEQGAGEADLSKGERLAYHDLWVDQLESGQQIEEDGPLVGEVILAPDFVTVRCRERDWPLEKELPWLLVHGCLHLLGWRHDQDSERRNMQAEEIRLLAGAGLGHPLAPDSN